MGTNTVTDEKFIELPKGAQNLTGRRFGRLMVLGSTRRKPTYKKGVAWLCHCDCGNTAVVMAGNLRSGHSRSCGCLSVETARVESTTHGMSDTRLYHIWRSMIQRCEDLGCAAYTNYGGRGISVCEEWRRDFKAFHDHVSMLEHYGKKGYSLDRINNNGNYEPGNVKWSTVGEQVRNTRANIHLTHDGKTQCVSDWAREMGMPRGTLRKRLHLGWPTERALMTPVDTKFKKGKI